MRPLSNHIFYFTRSRSMGWICQILVPLRFVLYLWRNGQKSHNIENSQPLSAFSPRLSPTTSSCVRPGGRPALAQHWAVRRGCTSLTTCWRITVSGQVWLSATSMSVMVPSFPSSFTRPRWPTTLFLCQRGYCPIGCCATGVRSPIQVTLPHASNRHPSAGSSVRPSGRAILIPVAGWSWTWQCVHMRRWEPGTIYVTSGTNWASTSVKVETTEQAQNESECYSIVKTWLHSVLGQIHKSRAGSECKILISCALNMCFNEPPTYFSFLL